MVYARLATGYRPGGPNALPPTRRRPTCRGSTARTKPPTLNSAFARPSWTGACPLDVAALPRRLEGHSAARSTSTASASTPTAARRAARAWNGHFAYLPVQGLTLQWTGRLHRREADLAPRQPSTPMSAIRCRMRRSGAPRSTASTSGPCSPISTASSAPPGAMSARAARDFASSRPLRPGRLNLAELQHLRCARSGLTTRRYRVTLYGKNLSDSRGITNLQSPRSHRCARTASS